MQGRGLDFQNPRGNLIETKTQKKSDKGVYVLSYSNP